MKKIELYRIRTFSDIFEDSIQWLKDNRRAVLKYIMPVALTGVLTLSAVFVWEYIKLEKYYDNQAFENIFHIILAVFILSLWLLPTMLFTLYGLYRQRENGLNGLTFGEFRKALPHFAMLMLSVIFVIMLLYGAITMLSISNALITIFVVLGAMAIPSLFIYPAVAGVNKWGIVESIRETVSKGFKGFGSIYKIILTLAFLGVLQFFLSFTSLGIILLVENYLPDSLLHGIGDEIMEYTGYFFTCVLFTASAYFIALLALVAAIHTYGSIKESEEGISIEAKIDNFENL